MKKNLIITLCLMSLISAVSSCFSAKSASALGKGGEVVGVTGKTFNEPTPYGMVRINRGYLKMGLDGKDSLWGKKNATARHIRRWFLDG